MNLRALVNVDIPAAPSRPGDDMTLRCPCGSRLEGNGDKERSESFRQHLIEAHGQDGGSLRMLEVREGLGEDVVRELLSMEMGMRAHLTPTDKSQEEILKGGVEGCGITCVSEFRMSREQMEDYVETITCPACGRKVGGDDDGELCEALRKHCDGHEQLRLTMRTVSR